MTQTSFAPTLYPVAGAAALVARPNRSFRAVPAARRSPVQKLGSAEVSSATALVVDPDPGARSLLTAALKREGFEVLSAADGEEALRIVGALSFVPELVLSEVRLPTLDGFSLCEALKERPEGAPGCVILLARVVDTEHRGMARLAGADELLPKPAFVSDIVALAKLKIVAEHHGNAHLIHSEELPLPQLVRALLTSGRSGRVRLRRGVGALAFRDGRIVDCSFEKTSGTRAVERMLALGHGQLEVTFGPTVAGEVSVDLPELCNVLLPRLRRFTRLLGTAVPLDAILAMDVAAFARAHASLPRDIEQLARLCDGRRSVRQILVDAPFGEVVALEALTRLYALGAVLPVGEDEEEEGPSSELVRVLERFASPSVARWAASNDERVIPVASSAEVREGLAPELLRQLDAFRIQTVVEPVRPSFEFAPDDSVISEVSTPAEEAYELPADELVKTFDAPVSADLASALATAVREPLAAPACANGSVTLAPANGPVSPSTTPTRLAGETRADEAVMVDAAANRAAFPTVRSTLIAGAAILVLGAGAALVVPRPSPRVATQPAVVAAAAAVTTETPWYPQAVRLYESGDVSASRELLEKVVAEDGTAAEAWAYLALARFDSGEASAAEVAALKAVELDPSNLRAELLLGRVAAARGDADAAARHLNRVVEQDRGGTLAVEARELLTQR